MRRFVTAWKGSALCALLCLAATVAAEAQPTTFLSFDSQPGDYIGGGRRFTLTPADGTFNVTRNYDQGVSVSFQGPGSSFWYLDFAAPGPVPLVPGMYEAATRFPFQSPTRPGLSVWGEGGPCNTFTSRFTVLEAVYDGLGNVQRFAADYEQHCGDLGPALFGSVRYESAVSLGPRLSVGRSSAYEGDVEATALGMVVSLSAPAASPVSVHYRTEDVTATAGEDYVAASGTLDLPAGQTAVTVPLSVMGDTAVESDETLALVLEEPQGAPLAFGSGVATIVNDDPYKTLLVFDSQPGDLVGGGRAFTVTPVDGSITAALDADNTVALTFRGETTWNLRFAAPDDGLLLPGAYEGAMGWPVPPPGRPGLRVWGGGCNTPTGRFVVLEAVYSGRAVERLAVDYEQHCDGARPALFGSVRLNSAVPLGPRVSVAGRAAYEGDVGTTTLEMVVSLSAPVASPVSVHYRTEDGTATAGDDYVAASGTLVIPVGATAGTVPVSVMGDTAIEGDEAFSLVLESPQGASLGVATGVATIANDDPDKTILIFDSQPGDSVGDGRTFSFTPLDGSIAVTLYADNSVALESRGAADSLDLHFAAPDGGLLVPGAYEDATRWPFQPAGRPGLLVGGLCNNVSGRFVVLEAVYAAGSLARLAIDYEQHCNGVRAALFGWVRYHSSVALPIRGWAEGGSATEGAGTGVVFKVKLSGTSPDPVSVHYATVDGSAIGDLDYERSSGTLVIPAGAFEGQVTVPVIDDVFHEETKTFTLHLTSPTGALIVGATAVGTIFDDDPVPTVSLGNLTVREGDPGRSANARVPVSLDRPLRGPLTLTYTTASGSATAGQDFVAPSGSLVLGPGQTSATIDVQLVGDLAPEADETFTVTLTAVPGAQIGVAQATVTIEDDDGPTDYYTVPPCRLLDTRLSAPPIRAGTSLAFGVGGVCGVPASAKAVVLNVTAVDPSATGHFRIAPTGTGVPSTSVLNFVAGRTQAAGPVISVLGLNDAATLYCFMATAGRTHAVVDVFGYFE